MLTLHEKALLQLLAIEWMNTELGSDERQAVIKRLQSWCLTLPEHTRRYIEDPDFDLAYIGRATTYQLN